MNKPYTLNRRALLGASAASLVGLGAAATSSKRLSAAPTEAPRARTAPGQTLNLARVKADVLAYCEALRDKEAPYGCYRSGPRKRTDLYASLDVAIMRRIMGEDLSASLSPAQRQEWVAHINSYQNTAFRQADGAYSDTFGHSILHANGMVIGALGALGGRQKHLVRLYDEFDTAEKALRWLEAIDWRGQWRASHLFWGGAVCFSFSRHCPPGWIDRVMVWLDANLDERTGWWRKGTPHADRHQPLGGSVHVLPFYQHHKRAFPYPERVIDSVLALQLENGRWLEREADRRHIMHYLELDALYALSLMQGFAPRHRKEDIGRAVERYGRAVIHYYEEQRAELFKLHPHWVLAAVGTFGLLHRLNPEMFPSDVEWTDIFSDFRLHDTGAVEAQ